jgi:hypothetical protein
VAVTAARSLAANRITRSPLRLKHDRRTLVLGAILARWRYPGEPEMPSQDVALKLMQDMLWRTGKSSMGDPRITHWPARGQVRDRAGR